MNAADRFARHVLWIGVIDSETMERVVREIGDLFKEDAEKSVTLILSSSGGSLDVAIAFHDLVRHTLNWSDQLEIHVAGEASSAAITVLMAADTRSSAPHSLFLFHPIKRHYFENMSMSSEELKEEARVIDAKFEKVLNIWASQMRTHEKEESVCIARKLCFDRATVSHEDMFELDFLTG